MTPVIRPSALRALLGDPALVLLDARVGPSVKQQYIDGHLRGARFVDLESDLSNIGPDASKGGRHPLPDIHSFAEVLGKLGIDPRSHVVVYDNKNGANFAARVWWMLRAAGHTDVQVLDGGYDAGVAAGIPVVTGEETAAAKKSAYPVDNSWGLPLADIHTVENVAGKPDHLVIDVRDAYRYNGESEPIDLVAGHIPGAVNIPLTGNLDEQGFFLSPQQLRANYEFALGGRSQDHVIVHCGSGVSACQTLLSMDLAGLPIPALYVGSWSEWSRTGRPIGKA